MQVWKRRCKTRPRTSTGSEPKGTECGQQARGARATPGSTCRRATRHVPGTLPRARRGAPATSWLRAARRARRAATRRPRPRRASR